MSLRVMGSFSVLPALFGQPEAFSSNAFHGRAAAQREGVLMRGLELLGRADSVAAINSRVLLQEFFQLATFEATDLGVGEGFYAVVMNVIGRDADELPDEQEVQDLASAIVVGF
jgi:hypothetical protein